MTVRPILFDPDPVLRLTCAEVQDFDGALGDLALDMLSTLYHAQGRGLAAPQIGVTQRLFVTDTDWKTGTPQPRVFVNPQIIDASGQLATHEERCLSIPDTPCQVARPDWVVLRWQTLSGAWQDERFEGVHAVIVQHERDHLDGILCTDKVSA